MTHNKLLYNAAIALIECARFVRPVDIEFTNQIIEKAQELKNKIIIDEEVEKEVNEFEKQIREGIKNNSK